MDSGDFTFSPTTLEFSCTDPEVTITVTLMDDNLLEPTEFIVIEVVDAINITGAEDSRSVNITIFDVNERESLTTAEIHEYKFLIIAIAS